jgi:hypothetical protein
MWAQFFVEKGLLSDHDSATEQWNSQTRMELSEKLDHEMQVFIEAKDLHKRILCDKNAKEPVLPSHEFGPDKKVYSRQINIKWNFNEFEVEYDCLRSGFLVGGYFL